jgi:hypothetical protein
MHAGSSSIFSENFKAFKEVSALWKDGFLRKLSGKSIEVIENQLPFIPNCLTFGMK